MTTAFQSTAFQNNAFQIDDEAPVTVAGETILQRHKVDRLWSGYGVSRKRYDELSEEKRKRKFDEAVEAEAEAVGKAWDQVEEARYGDRVQNYYDQGVDLYTELLRAVEQAQAEELRRQALAFVNDQGARQNAIEAFNRQAIVQAHIAQIHQLERTEEEEALELAMMLDD